MIAGTVGFLCITIKRERLERFCFQSLVKMAIRIIVRVTEGKGQPPKRWAHKGKRQENEFVITWEPQPMKPGHTVMKWYLDEREVGSWSYPALGFKPIVGSVALEMMAPYVYSVIVGNCD